jgi:hypothetical protein
MNIYGLVKIAHLRCLALLIDSSRVTLTGSRVPDALCLSLIHQ